MAQETKIKFNPNLPYQGIAVKSAIDLFNGQWKSSSPFTISGGKHFFGKADEATTVVRESNRLTISDNKILNNLRTVIVVPNKAIREGVNASLNDLYVINGKADFVMEPNKITRYSFGSYDIFINFVSANIMAIS